MNLPVIVRAAAEADIEEALAYLEGKQAGLSDRFKAQLRDVFERIEENPEVYGVVWQDVRAARLRRFQYVVYHVVFPDRVEVLAVMHGARARWRWQVRRGQKGEG